MMMIISISSFVLLFFFVYASPRPENYVKEFGPVIDSEALRVANRMYSEFKPESCGWQEQFNCPLHDLLFPVYCTQTSITRNNIELWKLLLTRLVDMRIIRNSVPISSIDDVIEFILQRLGSIRFNELKVLIGNETVAFIYVICLGILYQ